MCHLVTNKTNLIDINKFVSTAYIKRGQTGVILVSVVTFFAQYQTPLPCLHVASNLKYSSSSFISWCNLIKEA